MLKSNIPQTIKRLEAGVAEATENTAKRIKRGARGRVSVDTGDLRDSIEDERTGETEWRVEAGEWYGLLVEAGTRNKGPRPFMKPAAEAERKPFIDEIRGIFK